MRKLIYIFILLFSIHTVYSQVGVGTESVNAKATVDIQSPNKDKGVLIPRMSTAEILAIASPATGLLTYSTNNDAFYYYTGTEWSLIGQECTVVEDNDGDTSVEADNGSDNDEIAFNADGTTILKVNKDGIIQNIGDLHKSSGSVIINNAYTLPIVDGSNKEVMYTDGAGNISWRDPTTLPGLVAGIVTFPLVAGREMNQLGDKAWLSAIIPWSDVTVNDISFFVNVVGTPTIEIGIYNESGVLLGSNTVSLSTAGFQFATVSLTTGVGLEAGKLYRVAVTDRNRSGSTFLENPDYDNSNLHWGIIYPAIPQILPATISSYSTGQKPIWLCLY